MLGNHCKGTRPASMYSFVKVEPFDTPHALGYTKIEFVEQTQ
jgi:hypothetical protein